MNAIREKKPLSKNLRRQKSLKKRQARSLAQKVFRREEDREIQCRFEQAFRTYGVATALGTNREGWLAICEAVTEKTARWLRVEEFWLFLPRFLRKGPLPLLPRSHFRLRRPSRPPYPEGQMRKWEARSAVARSATEKSGR